MNELPKHETREYALADVLSRSNALNGLYQKLRLPLGWKDLNKKDALYITHMADLADKIIKEAIDSKKDLHSQKIQEELQAAFYGGAAGASLAIKQHKFLRFLGFRK